MEIIIKDLIIRAVQFEGESGRRVLRHLLSDSDPEVIRKARAALDQDLNPEEKAVACDGVIQNGTDER